MLKKKLAVAVLGALMFSPVILPPNNFLPAPVVCAEKKTTEEYKKDASEFEKSDDYIGAIELYRKALEINPNDIEALSNLRFAYRQLGWQYDNKALASNQLYEQQNFNKKKVEAYINYLSLFTDKAEETDEVSEGYWYLGMAYNDIHEYYKAIDCFNKSLILSDIFWDWFENEYGYGRNVFYRLYASDKSSNFNNLGKSYMGLGDYKKAMDYFKQYLDLETTYDSKSNGYAHGISTANIGICYANLNEYDKFFTIPKKITYYDRKDEITWRWLVFGKAVLGDFEEANEFLKISMELLPKDGDTYCIYGFVYAIQKNYSKALECINKALELNPTNSNYQEGRKFLLSKMN